MGEKDRLRAIKKHLATLARQEAKRQVPFDCGTKWWFASITDPRTGAPFTYSGSWDFVAEQLEQVGTKIDEIALSEPTGKKAYVLRVPTRECVIYIKVHFGFGGDVIIGRSFHS